MDTESIPPEQVEGVRAHPSADVYALGKVITFMLTGGTDPDRVVYPQWGKFVRACSAPKADDRPTLDELQRHLADIPT